MHTIRAGRKHPPIVGLTFALEPSGYGTLFGRKNPLSSMCRSR
jgi:hypothetical protein